MGGACWSDAVSSGEAAALGVVLPALESFNEKAAHNLSNEVLKFRQEYLTLAKPKSKQHLRVTCHGDGSMNRLLQHWELLLLLLLQ